MFVDRVLTDIAKTNPEIEIEKVDIISNPAKAWQAGVRMIPALKSGDRMLSGIILTRKDIQDFLTPVG